jgi:hypothetical protein
MRLCLESKYEKQLVSIKRLQSTAEHSFWLNQTTQIHTKQSNQLKSNRN